MQLACFSANAEKAQAKAAFTDDLCLSIDEI
jgi:hypothetical protein